MEKFDILENAAAEAIDVFMTYPRKLSSFRSEKTRDSVGGFVTIGCNF